jgi:VanZ family protein
VKRAARLFLLVYAAGVLYLSLYPWDFLPRPRSMELFRIPLTNRRLLFDAAMNVLLYVPLGAAAFVSLWRGWGAWIAATVFGGVFSYLIETAQLYTPTRAPTLSDVEFNTLGAAAGAALGFVLTAPAVVSHLRASRGGVRWALSTTQAVLLSLWVLWHTVPFLPTIAFARMRVELRQMLDQPWSWVIFAEAGMGFLALAWALGRSHWVPLALAVLPSQVLIADRNLSAPLLVGAVAGWVAARVLSALKKARGAVFLASAMVLWLAFEEFRPFQVSAARQPFQWSPAESWYQNGFATFYATIFRKLFLYSAVVWSMRETGARWRWAVVIPGLILVTGEWAQQYLEGRTPESTDLVLLAAVAGLLALVERQGR